MLKTSYVDDVFTGNRKYKLINNSDGTVSLVDSTSYTQEGDPFCAADANQIAVAIQRDYTVDGVAPSAFSSDSTYADYPYAATIGLLGASADDVPYVEFSGDWATNGVMSTIAQAVAGGVKVFAASVPSGTVGITRITLRRQNSYNTGVDPSIDGVPVVDAKYINKSIAVADVVANTDALASIYPYKYDLALSDITAKYYAKANPASEADALAWANVSDGSTQTLAGIIRVYFVAKPAAAVNANIYYWLVNEVSA